MAAVEKARCMGLADVLLVMMRKKSYKICCDNISLSFYGPSYDVLPFRPIRDYGLVFRDFFYFGPRLTAY
jgi:hypothetical protein